MGYKICTGAQASICPIFRHEPPENRQKWQRRGGGGWVRRREKDHATDGRPLTSGDAGARTISRGTRDRRLSGGRRGGHQHGLPSFSTVGLPHGAVREGRERIGAALANAGFRCPSGGSPSTWPRRTSRKTGSGLDLPIALGVLVASGQLPDQAARRAHGRRRGRPGGRSPAGPRRAVHGPGRARRRLPAAAPAGRQRPPRRRWSRASRSAAPGRSRGLRLSAGDADRPGASRSRRAHGGAPPDECDFADVRARPPPSARWRWRRPGPQPAAHRARPVPARPCSPGGFPPFCRP